jgi:hypothetical protein
MPSDDRGFIRKQMMLPGCPEFEYSLQGRRWYEAVSREGILDDAEEAGYDLVETYAFLPEDKMYILSRRH